MKNAINKLRPMYLLAAVRFKSVNGTRVERKSMDVSFLKLLSEILMGRRIDIKPSIRQVLTMFEPNMFPTGIAT